MVLFSHRSRRSMDRTCVCGTQNLGSIPSGSTMSYLAIDYGKKYIGLAVSDADGILAFPVSVINNDGKTFNTILNLIKEKEITGIVIGDSIDQNGINNDINKSVHDFGKILEEKTNLPIYYQNESFTSNHARNAINNISTVGRIDASASALILQRFLDKINKK